MTCSRVIGVVSFLGLVAISSSPCRIRVSPAEREVLLLRPIGRRRRCSGDRAAGGCVVAGLPWRQP